MVYKKSVLPNVNLFVFSTFLLKEPYSKDNTKTKENIEFKGQRTIKSLKYLVGVVDDSRGF